MIASIGIFTCSMNGIKCRESISFRGIEFWQAAFSHTTYSQCHISCKISQKLKIIWSTINRYLRCTFQSGLKCSQNRFKSIITLPKVLICAADLNGTWKHIPNSFILVFGHFRNDSWFIYLCTGTMRKYIRRYFVLLHFIHTISI